MALNFARSISFPLTPARSPKARHVRSISLPCSSHPLLAHLCTHIATVRSWIQDPSSPSSGLAHIHTLHAALTDIILLQDTRDVLHRATIANDRLLDSFLLLADAHQGFQESLLELKHAASEGISAYRRGDATRVASVAKSQRRAEKEIYRFATSVSAVFSKCARLNIMVSGEDAEMAGVLMEAASTSAAASAAVFSAIASMSASASSSKKMVVLFPTFVRKAAMPETEEAAVERLHTLEQCFEDCDGVCDKVFRSIVQTRVSLLNIMTLTI